MQKFIENRKLLLKDFEISEGSVHIRNVFVSLHLVVISGAAVG